MIALCLLMLALSVHASPVNFQEASGVAAAFLKQSSVKEVVVPFEHLYVFNGDHCFAIVPADDVVTPIIGYSHDRCFEPASMGDNLKGWLMAIDENIQACLDEGKTASDGVREQWDAVRKGLGLPVVNRVVVEPMVLTRWNQTTPYNDYCPGGCPTGCAATAMAQVMKYWEFPNHGIGSHSYVHPNYGTLSADFNAATYDWDHMRQNYNTGTSSDVEKQAIATLMYHCGVSMDMDYGPGGSAGQMTNLASILPNCFGYAPSAACLFERDCSDAEWKFRLKTELNASRPMCYAGYLPSSGKLDDSSFHAFVCDGYDESDYFHFNWGWGGSGDGYYAVGDFIETGHINYNYVILGISPLYVVAAPADLTASVLQRQIQLSWTMTPGSVSFNVYRDNELIATDVTASTYCDTTMSYGTHSYYVKAIDGSGNRSWKSNCVEIVYEFSALNPIALGATVEGDSLTLQWEMPSTWHDTLAYGTGPYYNSYGYSPVYPNPTFWGQRYPAEMLMPYGGYVIKGVSLYVTVSGPYTLNVCRGNDKGVTEVMTQQTYDIVESGWVDMMLDIPYPLEFTRDVWVVMNTPGGMFWVMAACEYDGPGLEDAAYCGTEMSSSFMTHGMGHSWMMKVMIEDDLTYRVARNDSIIASGVHGRIFVDHGVSKGDWNYKVWSSYQGVECVEPVSYTISLANVEVTSSDIEAGTVQGGGLAEVGSQMTVRAVPQNGCVFRAWMSDGMVVCTDEAYSFTVTGDMSLQAVFAYTYCVSVTAEPSAGGSVSGAGVYEEGDSCTLVAEPHANYVFMAWKEENVEISSDDHYTFTVESQRNFVAVFAPKYLTINAVASLGGTISPNGYVTVERGEDITFEINPDPGCSVFKVVVDGTDMGMMHSYTFHQVGDDHTIRVQFKGYGVGEETAEVRLFPNPVKDNLRIESTTRIRSMEIITLDGVMVENKKVDDCMMVCHLGGYAAGVYYLRFFTDAGVVTKKLVLSE